MMNITDAVAWVPFEILSRLGFPEDYLACWKNALTKAIGPHSRTSNIPIAKVYYCPDHFVKNCA